MSVFTEGLHCTSHLLGRCAIPVWAGALNIAHERNKRQHIVSIGIYRALKTSISYQQSRSQRASQSSCGGRFPTARFVLPYSSGSPDQGGYDTENIMLRCGNRELLRIYPCHHGADWNAQRRLCHPETHSSGMGWF